MKPDQHEFVPNDYATDYVKDVPGRSDAAAIAAFRAHLERAGYVCRDATANPWLLFSTQRDNEIGGVYVNKDGGLSMPVDVFRHYDDFAETYEATEGFGHA